MNQSKQKDVFILGAGFSKAISPEMPILSELSKEVRKRLSMSGLLVSVADLPDLNDDVELLLSYLGTRHPWQREMDHLTNRAIFHACAKIIADVIEEREETAVEAVGCPEWTETLLRSWQARSATVMTLNYDTLVERFMKETLDATGYPEVWRAPIARGHSRRYSITPSGGRVKLTFDYLKLHGSTNWFFSGDQAVGGDQIYYAAVAANLEDSAGIDMREADLRTLVDKVPLVVPPVADKTTYYGADTLRSIWMAAAESIQQAKRIFCMGYSFPLTDVTMRYFVETNAPKSGAEVFLVGLRDASTDRLVENYEQAFSSEKFQLDDRFLLPLEEKPIPSFATWYADEHSAENSAEDSE